MNIAPNHIYRLSIILVTLAIFTPVSLISKSAECAMVDSQMVLQGGKAAMRKIDTGKVRSMLENRIVTERLKAYGLSKEEIVAKMDNMSDRQINQLATLSDRITAGGIRSGYYIATSTIILIAIVVLLVVVLAAE